MAATTAQAWERLRQDVAVAAKVEPSVVTFELETNLRLAVGNDGQTSRAPVSVTVNWFAGRSAIQKQDVATAIHKFLIRCNQAIGGSTTFHDEGGNDYFVEGKPV